MNPLVAAALELTERVQAAIDGGDWARAQELETERRGLLERLAAAGDGQDLRPTWAALEQRNRRIIGLVEHQKRTILREAAAARSAQEGAAAYAEVRLATRIVESA